MCVRFVEPRKPWFCGTPDGEVSYGDPGISFCKAYFDDDKTLDKNPCDEIPLGRTQGFLRPQSFEMHPSISRLIEAYSTDQQSVLFRGSPITEISYNDPGFSGCPAFAITMKQDTYTFPITEDISRNMSYKD